MKKNLLNSRKFKHGSVSLALSVLIIAAVVIINVIATALASNYSFMYIDMTSEKLYTLSDEAKELLDRSFVDIMKKRGELNEELPLSNHEIAKDNIDTAEKNLLVAEEAVKTAEKNVALALINKEAFAQSVILARSNFGIATSNHSLAKAIAEDVAKRHAKGEATDAELALAEANLKTMLESMHVENAKMEQFYEDKLNVIFENRNELRGIKK